MSGKRLTRMIDPLTALAPKLELKRETLMMITLIHSMNGKTSSATDHCF